MKPQLVPPEKLQALEQQAGETLDKAAAQARQTADRLEHLAEETYGKAVIAARDPRTKATLRALDRMLAAVGAEISTLAIIALALAILCAPAGLGVAAIYFLSLWAVRASGIVAVGWGVAALTFLFLCRYVWGLKLQRASRRAALALIAAMAG